MRLRDLFSRRPPDPVPADPGPPAATGHEARHEWRHLPPVQRVLTGPSLVTAPELFRQQLGSWRDPSFLRAPGHLRSPDAPSGSGRVVAFPARPVPAWPAPSVAPRGA